MALRETHVDIDFTADADPLRAINREINQTLRQTREMGKAYDALTDESRRMLNEMRHGWDDQRRALIRYRNDMIAAEYDYFRLAKGSREYTGSTREFIREIERAGAAQKRVMDAMIENDNRARLGMYQTIGTMANMTTQAKRISDNYERMGNPLYNVNRGALAAANAMNRLANRSNAAAMALHLLGPTASMKSLRDMTMMISQGFVRMQMVALGALITSFLVYGALHKAAMKNKEYAESFNTMKENVRKALQPMVDVFTMVMKKVYDFISWISQLIIKFNEAHPTIAKIVQGIMMLVPALTLILSPLAIGIGLWAGFRAALGYIWPVIGPFITGMMSMMATVWLVAAAIVGLVAGFIYMYNKFAWFRNAVQITLNAIWNAFLVAFNFIKNSIVMPIVNAIVSFVQQKLAQLRAFWAQHGAQIMGLIRVALSFIVGFIRIQLGVIKGIFQVVWPIITGVVKVAWNLIKLIINNTISWIGGFIKAGLAIIRGDWDGAWNAIKGIAIDIWNNIEQFFKSVDLFQIGKDIIQGLINGISSMVGGVVKAVSGIANSIKDNVKSILGIHSPSRVMMELGVNTFQGYGIGMESERKNIQSIVYDMASIPMDYTPESSVTTTNNQTRNTVKFSPIIQLTTSSGSYTSVKQQVKEALDEAFDYLRTIYDLEVEY